MTDMHLLMGLIFVGFLVVIGMLEKISSVLGDIHHTLVKIQESSEGRPWRSGSS